MDKSPFSRRRSVNGEARNKMVQKIYPAYTFSLMETIDDSQWTLLKSKAGFSEEKDDQISPKLRAELQKVLNEYLSRLQGFEEAFSAKEIRDEIVIIKKKLGSLRDYILNRTGQLDIFAEAGSDSVSSNPYPKPVRLMSAALAEVEKVARLINPGVEIETFVIELELLHDAAETRIQSLTNKSGRVDDYFFDVFIYDILSALKACLGLGPYQERTYDIVFEMSRIARKIIERRGYAVNGIAVKWLSEDSVKQRITRALKAERVSGIIPDTKTR